MFWSAALRRTSLTGEQAATARDWLNTAITKQAHPSGKALATVDWRS